MKGENRVEAMQQSPITESTVKSTVNKGTVTKTPRSRHGASAIPLQRRRTGPSHIVGPQGGPFTCYLRSLGASGEPSPEAFQALWRSLRTAVVTELRRRSAWTSPPCYYGVYGWESWRELSRGPGRTRSALEELLVDCFTFVFVERLPRLRAQLALKPDIDGLVVLYLRNYLHDRRKRHDLLGFQIFESLRAAVRKAVDNGELWIVGGDSKVTNGTILAASPDAEPGHSAKPGLLAPIVESWNRELLPDIVTAAGPRRCQVVERLHGLVLGLAHDGVRVVRFKDLADELKRSVRASWAAVFDLNEGETACEDESSDNFHVVRLAPPGESAESRVSFEKIITCVEQRVENLSEPEGTRGQLRQLWGFLRVWAQGSDAEKLPSNRRLGELLDIPRKRLPNLWEMLKRQTRVCVSRPQTRVPCSERGCSEGDCLGGDCP